MKTAQPLERKYDNPTAVAIIAGEQKYFTNAVEAMAEATRTGGRFVPARETVGKVANGYIVFPGDKVVVLQHQRGGARFRIRGTVVKCNKRSIVVNVRYAGRDPRTGQLTGNYHEEQRTIPVEYVWRDEWE